MTSVRSLLPIITLGAAAMLSGACADTITDPLGKEFEDDAVLFTPPDSGTRNPPDSSLSLPRGQGRILIDATRDGGVWWFPQAGPFAPDSVHQGQALAEYLRSVRYTVDELGRDMTVTSALLDQYSMVIRAGEWGTPTVAELEAYRHYLEREVTVVLLSAHRLTDPTDELAEVLGVIFTGMAQGTIAAVDEHPTARLSWASLARGPRRSSSWATRIPSSSYRSRWWTTSSPGGSVRLSHDVIGRPRDSSVCRRA